MVWKPRKGQMIFRAEPTESVFLQPLPKFVATNEEREILPSFYKKLEGTQDHRALALLTALVLENFLDELLKSVMPRYQKLLEKSDNFTFSLKIATLVALKFVPEQITDCADMIRRVRNDFAHQLDLDSFDKLDQKVKVRIEQLCDQIYEPGYVQGKTIAQLYWGISFVAISGMNVFIPNAKAFRETIDNPQFSIDFEKHYHEKERALLDAALKEQPIEIEKQGTSTIKRFKNGIVLYES